MARGDRTLRLLVDIDADTTGATRAARALDGLSDSVGRVPIMAGRASESMDDFGDSAKRSVAQSGKLDTEIQRLTKHIREIRAEVDRTGKFELLDEKTFKADERRLAQLKRAAKAIAPDVDDGGLFKRLRNKLIATAVGAGVAAAPYLGAAIGSVITTAVGLVGIGGGIALAARDPRVKIAAAQLGHQVADDMFRAAKPFAAPTAAGLTTLRDTWAEIAPDITRSMHGLAGAVEPLADGLAGFVKTLTPGFTHAMDQGAKFVGVFADELPEFGDHLGDMFSALADGKGNVEGLRDTMELLGNTLEFVGRTVGFLSDRYAELKGLRDIVPDDLERLLGQVANPLAGLGEAIRHLNGESDQAEGNLSKIAGHINLLGRAAQDGETATWGLGRSIRGAFGDVQTAANTVGLLTDAIDDYITKTLALDDANIAWQQGLDDLAEELGTGARTLDINTQAGRDNAEAILRQIGLADQLRKDMLTKTPTAVAAANKAYQDAINQIYKLGRQAGLSKKDLDALVGKYKIDIDVAVNQIKTNLSNALKPLRNLGFAAGGYPPMTGEAFTVGEAGTELMSVQNGRLRVHSASQTRRMLGGGGGTNVLVQPMLTAGADAAFVDWIFERLRYKVRAVSGGNVQAALGR